MRCFFKSVVALATATLFFTGCGSSNETSTGVFIDDVVSGIKYVNGENTGFTNEKGEFPYKGGTVEFYLGNIKIGEVDFLNDDKKVFVQDIVGVDRTSTDDPKVLKIASLLQSLDSDNNTDAIEISKADFNKFDGENLVIDDINVGVLLDDKGFEKVSDDDVKRHLVNVIKSYGLNENVNPEDSNIVIKNIETSVSRISSKIVVTFSEDIKKDNLKEIISLLDLENNSVEFDLIYKFDSVVLTLKEQINSFDNYSLSIDMVKLTGYGTKGENSDINITFASDVDAENPSDIIPPKLELDIDYTKNVDSNLSRWSFSGNANDRDLEKVILNLNGKEIQASIEDGKFVIDAALNAGSNSYEIIALDTSGNRTSISSFGGISLTQTVAAGGSHSGALKNGNLYTWGRNNYGQTGLGYTSKLTDEENGKHPISPVKIETPSKFVFLSFNQNYSLSIDENGNVYSWGYDKYGELGRGDKYDEICGTTNCRLDIGKVESLSNISYISAGYSHALAIKTDNTIWAFGTGSDGELGNGITENSSIPIQVNFGSENPIIVQVSAGSDFSLALDSEGKVWAWGKNNYGQIGQGEEYGTADQINPIKVSMPNNSKIVSLATGKGHALALAEDGTVYGWGLNATSQIGYYGYQYKGSEDAWDKYIYSPIKILDNDVDNPVIQVYAGGNSSYILRADKKVYPWGQYGETLEDGSQDYNNLDFPEDKLTAITSVKNIAAGALHVSAVKEDDTVFTWRWSFEGSLGGGESTANIWFYLYPIIPEFPEE